MIILGPCFGLALLRLPIPSAELQLDSSYRQAYAHFLKTDAQAGIDYIFNYGPLGHFLVPFFDRDLYWLDFAVASATTSRTRRRC